MSNIETLYPHGGYIFKLHFDFDWKTLYPICKELVNSELAYSPLVKNGKSSHMNKLSPHKIEEFRPYYSWLSSLIKEIFTKNCEYSEDVMDYFVANSWVNVQGYDGHTTIHNHANVFMVATAYLNLPKDGGFFECVDPLEYNKSNQYHDDPNWMWKEVPAITGDVLVFPGWLKHRTQVNNAHSKLLIDDNGVGHEENSSEDRWVLTTNFTQEFKEIV